MMIHVEGFFVVIFIGLVSQIDCEIFSSIDELEKLQVNEKLMIDELKVLANELKDDYVNRKLKSWKDEHDLIEKNVRSYITNPLNAFALIKRATTDIDLIAQRFPEQSKRFLEKVENIRPTDDDLSGAVEGLLRLQTIYKLKTVDFANGIIDGKKTRELLTAQELFVIGDGAFRLKNQDYLAIEYLDLVFNKLNQTPDPDVDINTVLTHQASCFNRTGSYQAAPPLIEKLIIRNPNDSEFNDFKKQLKANIAKFGNNHSAMLDPFNESFVKDGRFMSHKEQILYSQVCRGNVSKTPSELSRLHCRYVSNSAFSKLARFKVQEFNLDPYIASFIDVVYDKEIEFLKTISKPKAKPAQIFSFSLKPIKSSSRVAQNSWHCDTNEMVAKISRRIEDMTGLSISTAECLQVQNYGLAGHYSPHFDHRNKGDEPFDGAGNRIATVLLYLTDVEKGGATVFPYLKVRIPAEKGSAAFWYNLKTNGDGIYSTKHAGCPVLLGSKWVANKWIREHGQEFRRPCEPQGYVEEEGRSFYYKEFF